MGVDDGGQGVAEEGEDDEDIVDAFEEPGGHLREERDLGCLGDEVGADDFAGAPEEDEGGEADGGGAEKSRQRTRGRRGGGGSRAQRRTRT